MGDTLKKVKSGDPLVIPAQTFNTFIDAARDFRRRQLHQGQRPQPATRHTGLVLVKNASGSDRNRFDILGIDAPIFTPSESVESFKNAVALSGVTPSEASHSGSFVILLEPVGSGEIGLACAQGVCPVKVNVTDTDHPYADVSDGEASSLTSGTSGAAFILWKETGTGEKWAVVRLGVPAGASAIVCKVKAAHGNATYTVRQQSMTDQTTFTDKAGTSNFTATNISEIGIGPGSAVDVGTLVSVTESGGYYVFSHPAYAKYLD